MKKRFGVGVVLLIGIVLLLSVLAARQPTVGQDSGAWGTLMNDFLSVVHDSGGSLKGSVVGSSQISDIGIQAIDINQSVVNATHIVDATIGAIDIANDVINATHLSAVSTLIFGQCTRDIPAFAIAAYSNDTNANGTAGGNCTISGASSGNPVIITPSYGGTLLTIHPNLTINGARIVGSNLSINFTRLTTEAQAAIAQASHITFYYMVFVNGSG